MGQASLCAYEKEDDAVGDTQTIVDSMVPLDGNPFPKFKLVQKEVHLDAADGNPWGIGMNFKEDWEAWKISQADPNNQGYRAGVRVNWRVKSVNGVVLNKETHQALQKTLSAGKACDIVFEHLEPAWTPMMYTTREKITLRLGPTKNFKNSNQEDGVRSKGEICFIDDAYLYDNELVGEFLDEIPKLGLEPGVEGWGTIYVTDSKQTYVEPYREES